MIFHARDEYEFHDSTLVGFSVDWHLATAKILIERHETTVCLEASGLTGITLRRDLPWGESVSVITTSAQLANGNFKFGIEMQTGDKIDIEAASFSMTIKPY